MAVTNLKTFKRAPKRKKRKILKNKPGQKVSVKDFRGFGKSRQRSIVKRSLKGRGPTGGVRAPANPSDPQGGQGADPNAPPGETGPVPAPQLPSSAAAISGAETNFALAEGVFNQNMLAAAQAYGDPDILEGIGGGPVSPISALATIERNQGLARTALGERENRGNTFFSGLHIRDLGLQSDEFSNQRLSATQRYQSATQNYNNILAEAIAERDQIIADAGAADITAFGEGEPTDEAPIAGGGQSKKKLEDRLKKAKKSGNKALIKSIKAKLAQF